MVGRQQLDPHVTIAMEAIGQVRPHVEKELVASEAHRAGDQLAVFLFAPFHRDKAIEGADSQPDGAKAFISQFRQRLVGAPVDPTVIGKDLIVHNGYRLG